MYNAILFLRTPQVSNDNEYHTYDEKPSYTCNTIPQIGQVILLEDQVPYEVENVFHRVRTDEFKNDKLLHSIVIFARHFDVSKEDFSAYKQFIKKKYSFVSFSLPGA